MPGKIKVKVLSGRNLPVMDRAGDTTDAFVEIKFGGVTHKTDVCRKSLNPHWNSTEWYRFEVDESELQDEPLQLRLMDHDTYSANDAIGKVVISLAPLLAREANNTKGTAASHPGAVMSGWIPVFDTMHGIRGELNVIVKVELFSDFNKYKTSSCGVQFFHCPTIPPGYRASAIHGFVEELVVNDDPEYQWIDKIRTPRASNEARQVAFIKLSNQVQRLVGLKAAELGANAVVGYQQDFDLEGEAGVVARAIGTAVSITPLPTPSQPINIPPCTQQQLKKYLDILANDNDSITDLNEYFQHHQDELLKLLSILNPKTPAFLDETENNDDDDRDLSSLDLTRQSSLKGYAGNVSIYQDFSQNSLRHLSEDQTDLNRLLNREDSDDSTGPLKKLKKIRSNFFVKRLGSLRSRKSVPSDDQISIKSNSSDSSRISLTDIRNEFKKLKKPKFRKAKGEDDGIGMASVLARSVIHAHTSLACIAETQDSENSPSSTMRRTSESEPTINMSDDDKTRQGDIENQSDPKTGYNDNKKKIPDIHFTSLTNINAEIPEASVSKKTISESCPTTPIVSRSENLLKLPGEPGYFGSVSSALSADSSEIYSSSDEDDESSDQRTDTEKSIETTSSVVRSVLNHEVDPQLIDQMDRKLSVLEMASPELHEVIPPEITEKKIQEVESQIKKIASDKETVQNTNRKIESISKKDQVEATTSAHKDIGTLVLPKSNNNHLKLHNPFIHKKSESMSAPSSPVEKKSFVYRSSKRIKRQLSKISKSSMIKSFSHYSLIPKKKHAQTESPLSQPSSASDVPSKFPSHETVLGAPFLSYTDLLSLDKEVIDSNKVLHKSDELNHTNVKMYIGSEPVSRASLSGPSSPGYRDEAHLYEHKLKKDKISLKPTGLVHTAMETILIDKVQSLLIPTSPDPTKTKEKQFFDNVTDKLVEVEKDRNQKEIYTNHPEIHTTKSESMKEGLIKTAVETILVDKLQSILPPLTSQRSNVSDNQFAESERTNLTKMDIEIRDNKNENLVNTEITEKDSLVHTAMETILMDKMQALLPPSIETVSPDENNRNINKPETGDESKDYKVKGQEMPKKKESLFHTAMETMLIDKVQTLISSDAINENESELANANFVKNVIKSQIETNSNNNNSNAGDKSDSLIHIAMQTMLIDKMQTLLPPATHESNIVNVKSNEKESHIDHAAEIITGNIAHEHNTEPNTKDSLLHTAMEAMLIDKFQSIFTPIKLNEEPEGTTKNSDVTKDEIKSETKNRNAKLDTKSESKEKRDKKLVRQDSIHSVTEEPQMSKGTNKKTILQHFHPIKSGKPLETIPSLPESNLDYAESLDIEGVDTNSVEVSVCNNSHAAWDVDRSERKEEKEKEKGSPRHARHESYGGREPVLPANASLNSSSTPLGIHRRSSDSDLSVTPKGSSLNTSLGNTGTGGGAILRPSMNSNNLEMLEYPFLTMTEYPPGFIVHLGGTVCARSVKLVDGGGSGGESAARAACWAELRTELRAHARALRCNAVIAYADTAAICEDVCVLSASGTAAVINLDCDFNADIDAQIAATNGTKSTIEEIDADACSIAHVPYSPGSGPYRAELSACGGCRRARVPAVLLATCSKPNRLKSYGKAVTLTAVAARVRRAPPAGEPGARDISDQLPFLEYELHKMLLAKLHMQGANALFSLQTQIAVGERCVMALASGTAVRLAALPPPTPPRIKASENDKNALEIQKALWDSFTANKAANGYDVVALEHNTNGVLPEAEGDEPPVLDLCADKDACVLELDEAEDVETAKALASRRTHMQVYTNNLKATPGAMPFAFAQVWRARLTLTSQGCPSPAAERHVRRALDGVTYKLRRLQPCALITPRFQLDLPEDEIQLVISGAAVPLVDPSKPEPVARAEYAGHHGNGTGDADDDIFALDEEQLARSQEVVDEKPSNGQVPTSVCLTTLSAVSGARAATRVCALRLLFVRETTYVRELGGVSGLSHTFTCEVLAIVRAYTAALGGNALTSFYLTQLMLQDNAHKNQGQCLLSVGGDVVHITY